ncbi:3-deoxy-D-manno-octulosonic acid transferase [Lewinella sp. W8]|uniref:3-deoxy-D-manno-octulosonic acid transferase n=1 Tax=Lewinella sp. W8 TaxID=2528208 RepID=UPI0010687C3A|nr:glycosyltransferase N-terminal domain-containing protein [Lewinella sp. W8]MTB51541.1 3-deoxy-D-manno-octulosonic acid transferase [Lewinella sp. W8]
MTFLYRLGVRAYHTLISMAALLGVEQARKWMAGRVATDKWLEEIEASGGRRSAGSQGSPAGAESDSRVVWMHCASLGEWEQGRPVFRALRDQRPHWRYVLTFFSPSGFERHGASGLADEVLYLPRDGRRSAKRWIKALQPDAAIFVKYEFWYDHLRAIREANVPLFLVAGSFRPQQPFFRPWGKWWLRMLDHFSHLFVQTDKDRNLLQSAGYPPKKITVAGDPRMDRTLQLAGTPFSDPILKAFTEHQLTVMAGSVWPEDVSAWKSAWPHFRGRIRLVLAPHQLHEREINEWTNAFSAVRYTQTSPEEAAAAEVLILDTIGILSRSYRFAQLAYVGGAFRTGLHNTLEPQAYGLPVIMGPKHHKFPEAAAAIRQGGAFSLASAEELREVLENLLITSQREQASRAQTEASKKSAGAGERTAREILSSLG